MNLNQIPYMMDIHACNRPTQHPATYLSYRQHLQRPTGANPVAQKKHCQYFALNQNSQINKLATNHFTSLLQTCYADCAQKVSESSKRGHLNSDTTSNVELTKITRNVKVNHKCKEQWRKLIHSQQENKPIRIADCNWISLNMDSLSPVVFINMELLPCCVGRRVRTVIQFVRSEGLVVIGKSPDEKQIIVKV